LSLNEEDFFANHISAAKEKYKDTPVIKSADGKRPADGVHIRGVMMFYEIYRKYGIDTITKILRVLSGLEVHATNNFLNELRNVIGNNIPNKMEQGLTMTNYTGLFDE